MKRKITGKSILAGLLALALCLSLMPVSARAASSGEIREQIKEMKKEAEAAKEELEKIRGQYRENMDEMVDLVEQKDLIDQEISILNEQVRNINTQIAAYSLLIADKQDELDNAQARYNELNEQNKERIRAMEEDGE